MIDNAPSRTLNHVLDKLLDVKRAWLWKIAEKYNVTPLQIQILHYLDECASRSEINANIIARELYVTRATMSVALKALERKGLIRKISAKDKRTQYLSCTRKAAAIVNKVRHFEELFVSHLAQLSERTARAALKVLVQLFAQMQDAGMVDHVAVCIKCGHCSPVSNNIFLCNLTGRTFSVDAIEIGCCNYRSKREAAHA